MKALSLTQPWAWLVLRPDVTDTAERKALWATDEIKGIENRVWNTKFRGEFLVHAAKGMKRSDYDAAREMARGISPSLALRIPPPEKLERGGIVGVASVFTVIHPRGPLERQEPLKWHMTDQYGFVLGGSKPLPFTPCKGALGFWEVPASILSELQSRQEPLNE